MVSRFGFGSFCDMRRAGKRSFDGEGAAWRSNAFNRRLEGRLRRPGATNDRNALRVDVVGGIVPSLANPQGTPDRISRRQVGRTAAAALLPSRLGRQPAQTGHELPVIDGGFWGLHFLNEACVARGQGRRPIQGQCGGRSVVAALPANLL